MNISRLFLILLTAVFYAATLRAEDNIHCRVQLKVTASEDVRGEVTSFLSRELRRLGDIDVVEDDPLFVISVIALSSSNRTGSPIGYTMSILVEMPVRARRVRDTFVNAPDENMMKMVEMYFENTTRMLSHFVQLGGPDDLDTMCKKTIANIDTSVFEDNRKIVRKVLDYKKKLQESPAK